MAKVQYELIWRDACFGRKGGDLAQTGIAGSLVVPGGQALKMSMRDLWEVADISGVSGLTDWVHLYRCQEFATFEEVLLMLVSV